MRPSLKLRPRGRLLVFGCFLFAAAAAAQAPPAAPTAQVPSSPHGENPLADVVAVAPELEAGTIRAEILDNQNRPVPNQEVRLSIHFETIAEGKRDEERRQKTDAAGKILFDGQKTGSAYQYRIVVDYAGAEYGSESFQLGPSGGVNVRLHVFPVTSSLSETRIATRALYTIEPRDEVFQVQALIRVTNYGPLAFKPKDFELRLPEDAKAFADDTKRSQRFEEKSGILSLRGTFAPFAHHDIRFRFQVPNTNTETQSFSLELLPQAIESRVIIERGPNLQLAVTGYGEVQEGAGPNGRPIIWAQHIAERDGELNRAEVVISGLPTIGPARIGVAVMAVFIALLGVWAARRSREPSPKPAKPEENSDLLEAQAVLFEELRALEQAFQSSRIGPKTYERARHALLAALVQLKERLEPAAPRAALTGPEAPAGELLPQRET